MIESMDETAEVGLVIDSAHAGCPGDQLHCAVVPHRHDLLYHGGLPRIPATSVLDMAHIRVTGSGEASSAPDEASFHFHCRGHAADAPAALAQATAAAEAVLTLLDARGIAAEDRGVQRAHVHPRTRWVKDRERREGWDANASVRCTLADPEDAFALLEDAAEIDQVSISGPHWEIRQDNPAHDEARTAAVADARAKAASYAAAAGLELGPLVELIEGGAEAPMPMLRSMAMPEAAGGASLEPAHQSLHATVTLVYEAS